MYFMKPCRTDFTIMISASILGVFDSFLVLYMNSVY